MAADTKPMERKTDDRQIIDLLASIHDRGANMFNAGDHAGSYRLFQGTLLTVRLVLPKEIQDLVDRGFARADLEPNYVRRALVLHEVIEDVRKKLHPTAGSVEKLGQPRKADTSGTSDGLKAPDEPKKVPEAPRLAPSATLETKEPPKAPSVAPKKNESTPPPPILQSIPTSNPKKPMPPPDAPAPSEGLTVPPRPMTPAQPMTLPPAPLPVTPASGPPDLAPLPMPPKKENSSAPPPLIAPGK
jgi:hypothetical protein